MKLCAFNRQHPIDLDSHNCLAQQTDPTIISFILKLGFHQNIHDTPTIIMIDHRQAEKLVDSIGQFYRQIIHALLLKKCTYYESDDEVTFNFAEAVNLESKSITGLLYHVKPNLTITQLLKPKFVKAHLSELLTQPASDIIDQMLFETIDQYSTQQIVALFTFFGKIIESFKHKPSQKVVIICKRDSSNEQYATTGT